MNARWMIVAAATLSLQACGRSDPGLDQTGSGKPPLPGQQETLLPPMKIATPVGWNGQTPTVPKGFAVTALATDLRIPRQILVLPNGDILVAEGSGGTESKLRPKDFIAGFIKAKGKTKVKGGNRITLLRDADGDGRAEVRTVLIGSLNAPYGMAFVDGTLYVANQDALLRFPFQPGQTKITATPQRSPSCRRGSITTGPSRWPPAPTGPSSMSASAPTAISANAAWTLRRSAPRSGRSIG
jgi:glucose/arabinose dehydrogenase